MKLTTILPWLPVCHAAVAHRQLHHAPRKHSHLRAHPVEQLQPVAKRGGTCAFPTDDSNLVQVTPSSDNGGWALSPDQLCALDGWCPFACKPGMLMAQWQPNSTYDYPASMNGGLYCGSDGTLSSPFPDSPNCVEGTGTVSAVNDLSQQVSFCQTVLPGNENMLIPTVVSAGSDVTLAVPGPDYWCGTAAHYYINPPGTGSSDCAWGTSGTDTGNWSPYVAGANTDSGGLTYVKIGWNPIWQGSSLSSTLPSFGVKVTCSGGGCNGLPCEIDPNSSFSVDSPDAAVGAGSGAFCVVTVPSGGSASIVLFDAGSGGSSSGSSGSSSTSGSNSAKSTATPSPTSTKSPWSSSSSSSSATTEKTSEKTSETTTEVQSATEASTTDASTTLTSGETTAASTGTGSSTATNTLVRPTIQPGIFHENSTSSDDEGTTTTTSEPSQAQSESSPTSSEKKGEAGRQQGSAAFAGLIVAFVAAACFF